MRKIVLGSLIGCLWVICVTLGTGHAEELTNYKFLASAKPAKTITVDGVEYVLKGSEKSCTGNGNSEGSKQQRSGSNRSDSEGKIYGSLENFSMKGKYSAGLEASIVNLGIGPSAEYWLTDNIVASGHLGLGSFATYGIRGDYVFSKPLKLYNSFKAEPYVGLGYTFIKGPEESFPGGSVKTEGSGVDLHAGLFMPAQYIYKNVALRAEVAYSTATVDATATAGATKVTVSGDFNSFGLGFGVYYFFN